MRRANASYTMPFWNVVHPESDVEYGRGSLHEEHSAG